MASKFQNADSTKWSVGISVKLLSAKLSLASLPKIEEDLAELLADLEERVEGSSVRLLAHGGKVVLLEAGVLPGAALEHVDGKVSLVSLDLEGELGALAGLVVDQLPATVS